MATRYPPEFRRCAVELARLREKPIKQLATALGVSDQTLRNWLRQADVAAGRHGCADDSNSALRARSQTAQVVVRAVSGWGA